MKYPLLALHLPKSHTEAITRVLQIVTYVVREKGMEYKGKLWLNHDVSTGAAAAAVGKKAHFRMKRH